MNPTGVSQVPHTVNNFYDRELLERARPNQVHEMFGQMRPIPKNNTGTVKFRRYQSLAVSTDQLEEGVTPDALELSIEDITANLGWYGGYVLPTDKLTMETLDNVVMNALDVLGEHASDTMDLVVRDELHTGTSVVYGGDATQRSEVADGDTPDETELDAIITMLKGANAKKVTEFVKPDEGYATTPVRACYVALIHTDLSPLIEGLTGFEHAEKYENKANTFPGELGRYKDIRFVETTHGKIFEGEGATSSDVYSILIFGRNAYGVTKMNGMDLTTIVKPLGSSGSADPLNQRSSVGWKGTRTSKILNNDWIIRYEVSAVAAG